MASDGSIVSPASVRRPLVVLALLVLPLPVDVSPKNKAGGEPGGGASAVAFGVTGSAAVGPVLCGDAGGPLLRGAGAGTGAGAGAGSSSSSSSSSAAPGG
jgi:hypothetical protein